MDYTQVKKVCNTRICYDLSNRFNKQIKCLHCSKYKVGRVFISANKPFFISLPNCMLVNRKWMTVGLKSMRRLTQQGRVWYPFRNSNGMYYSCMYYGSMGYKVSKEGYKLAVLDQRPKLYSRTATVTEVWGHSYGWRSYW